MVIFLPEPAHRSGPDGQGWNRLSLNAHMEQRDQCGLQPTNYPTLFESMTGRQRWGGFGRCNSSGACTTCAIQRAHLDGHGIDLTDTASLILARVVPVRPAADHLFGGISAGRSTLTLSDHPDGPTRAATWAQIRNTPGLTVGRAFHDDEGEAFWLLRHRAEQADMVVTTSAEKHATIHHLHTARRSPALATATCDGPCSHSDAHLRALAADLATRLGGSDGTPAPSLLPGAPGVQIEHHASHATVRRHDTAMTITATAAIPSTALCAHAVRLTA